MEKRNDVGGHFTPLIAGVCRQIFTDTCGRFEVPVETVEMKDTVALSRTVKYF